jgi:hypothetical protein
MSVNLSPVGNGFQFFTNNGEPLVGGKLDTYQAGSTTPLTTFTDSSGLIPNTNPIILGTDGRPPDTIWLSEGFFYKFVLSDANDVVIQTYDNLYGIINATPLRRPPSPLAAFCCGLGRLALFLRVMCCVMAPTERQTLETGLLLARVRPMRSMQRAALRMQLWSAHTHTASVTDPGHTHPQQGQTKLAVVGTGADGTNNNATQPEALRDRPRLELRDCCVLGNIWHQRQPPAYYALCYIMKT